MIMIRIYPTISSAEDALCFEHVLPWIHQIMLAYEEQEDCDDDPFNPNKHNKFSIAYYSKKLN